MQRFSLVFTDSISEAVCCMDERLQKILGQWGIASRRQAEQMILAGRVRVNGNRAQLGQKADPVRDRIEVDGVSIQPSHRPVQVYLLLNKPAGVVSTCSDPWGRKTVLDLLPRQLRVSQGIHPVGRLDVDSTGALLLTNDGDLTFWLTHPNHCVPKTYQVKVEGHPPESVLQQWREGVILSGKKTLPAVVRAIGIAQASHTLLEVAISEGRNRQIRRVAEQLGYPVVELHRIAIGPIQLQPPGDMELPSGRYRPLKEAEISSLWSRVHLTSVSVPVDVKEQRI